MTTLMLTLVALIAGTAGAQLKSFDQAKGMAGGDGGFIAPAVGQVKEAPRARAQAAPAAPQASQAPDFALTNLKGGTMSLSAHKGKVVLIDFFATWCPPCQKSTPYLVELHKTLGARGLVVLGIAVDATEGKAKLEAYVAEHKIPYEVAIDEKREVRELPAYASQGIPTFVIVNKDGTIKTKLVGFLKDEIEAALAEALAAK